MKLSGYLGIDADKYSLRQIYEKSHGKQEHQWTHTSQLLAFIHNGNCSSKKDMRTAAHFNPFSSTKDKRLKRPGDVHADTTIFKRLLPLAKAAAKDVSMKPRPGKRQYTKITSDA